MKRALLILLAAVMVIAGFYYYPRWSSQRPAENFLKFSGNIEAHESLVSFKVTGRIIALPVEEGQAVKAGQLLARLDDDDYHQQVAVEQANERVRDQQLTLSLAGSRSQEIKAAEQAVLDAKADLEQKKKDLQRYEALYRKDEIPGQTRDLAETNVNRAQANYERLRQVYNQLTEGTRAEEISVGRANVDQARQSLQLARIRLGYTALRAPLNGVVLVRQVELGEVVVPGTPIVTLADLEHIWVRVYVPETDLGRVRWGQEATVRTDTYPEKSYRGRISFISAEAEFTPKSVETQKERVTLVYRMKIDVENPAYELKPGMPADVFIALK